MTTTTPSTLPAIETEPVVGNYFVAAYPPFSVWHAPDGSLERVLDGAPGTASLGLYVHIPFCHKKCDYCYYLSYVGQSADVVTRYLRSLETELRLYADREAVRGRSFSYVYFGGGTPSTLTPGQVRQLGASLQALVPWRTAREVTFECAPRTVREELLVALEDIGVTRVSMGVQSFDDALLKLNGRVHLSADVSRAFARLRRQSFECINLDLMVGLMGETWSHWKDSIQRAIDLGPESITIYQTEVPFNTQLYRNLSRGAAVADMPSWAEKRDRLRYGFEQLEQAGYRIASPYSAVLDPSRHSFVYQRELWSGGDMLGLGVAAFSYFQGVHYQNAVTLEKYSQAVEQRSLPVKRLYCLSERDRLVRELVLQLKLGRVSIEAFRKKFGVDLREAFAGPLQWSSEQRWLTISDSAIALTTEGLLNADWLVRQFYDPAFQHLRYT